MTPWLHIVGLGAEGMASLSPAARAVLETAEVIVGGARHHDLTATLMGTLTAERIVWPSPFDALVEMLRGLTGRRVVVLVTGDPLWFSAGAKIARAFDAAEITIHPQLSAFQLAAARMGWSLADAETLTAHGRPVEQLIPAIAPDRRLLILTAGAETPREVARLLAARGYAPSRLSVLADMSGPDEARIDGTAEDWVQDAPAFHTLAVECVAGPGAVLTSRAPGLADALFASDGTMTKQEVRAMTLARLMPLPGQMLWDVGCGCGSVAVEWMRAATGAQAIGIETRDDRRALAATNATRLGTPGLRLVAGRAPAALAGLPPPDAVFIGGGLTAETFAIARAGLRPRGRIVANAVTLATEAVLIDLHRRHGGELTRIAISRADPVGRLTGWRPLMPVTQWSLAT